MIDFSKEYTFVILFPLNTSPIVYVLKILPIDVYAYGAMDVGCTGNCKNRFFKSFMPISLFKKIPSVLHHLISFDMLNLG